MVTLVDDLVMLDFLLTPQCDEDGFHGAAVLVRDPVGQHYAITFWTHARTAPNFVLGLHAHGIHYEIRDEVTSLTVPTKDGLQRLTQTREFIGLRGEVDLHPVTYRRAIDRSSFRSLQLPARAS